jgi:hypothetical protein
MYAGDLSFSPWIVSGTSLKIRCNDQNGWLPATATCFFDMTGSTLEYGELSANIDTVVDRTYTILFNYGTPSEASQIYNLYINLDGLLVYTATAVPGIDNWNLVTYSFVATATTHLITLYSDQGFDDMSAYIDSPRIYTCVSQPRPWCLKTYNTLESCGLDSTVVDYQQKPCGCDTGVLNGDCLTQLWNFSMAEQCYADDDTGLFGVCETRPSNMVTRADIGECVETQTSDFAIVYQPTEAANARKRAIGSTLWGYPVLDYLMIKCGECVALPNTTLYAKVTCHNGKVSYYVDSACLYAVSEEYVMNQYANVEYSTEYVFVLTATDNPDKCEMISVGQTCANNTRVNTSIEHSCWSESTYLPAGTFAASSYKSFRINCPSKQIQFYLTTDCTGPVQYSDGSTAGCRIPHPTVNISADDNLLCGCGLSNSGSSSVVQSSSLYSSSVQTSEEIVSSSQVVSSVSMSSNGLPESSSAQLDSSEGIASSSQLASDSSELLVSSSELPESSSAQINSESSEIPFPSSDAIPSSSQSNDSATASSDNQLDSSSDIATSESIPSVSESQTLIGDSSDQPSASTMLPSASVPSESSQPWTPTTTTTEPNACFMEFSDPECTVPIDYYGIQQNSCNALNGIASFGAFLNITTVTTYVNQNCTVVTNAFGYGVCVMLLNPYEHWGMFTLGPCVNITTSSSVIVTSLSSEFSSSEIVQPTLSSDYISSEIIQTSDVSSSIIESSTVPATSIQSTLPVSTGLFLYLPYTNTI